MKQVYISSKQKDIRVKRSGVPSFNFIIADKPVLVNIDVADYLVNQDPDNFKISKEGVEAENSKDELYKELVKIKGIGSKTAKDIVKQYTSKEDLISAIKAGASIAVDDNIEEILKKEYGGD